MAINRIEIGNRLTEIRRDAGLSQKEMGKALGISWRTYQNYEIGSREISAVALAAVKEKFDTNLNWILFGEGLPDQMKAESLFASNALNLHLAINESGETLNESKGIRSLYDRMVSESRRGKSLEREDLKIWVELLQEDKNEK